MVWKETSILSLPLFDNLNFHSCFLFPTALTTGVQNLLISMTIFAICGLYISVLFVSWRICGTVLGMAVDLALRLKFKYLECLLLTPTALSYVISYPQLQFIRTCFCLDTKLPFCFWVSYSIFTLALLVSSTGFLFYLSSHSFPPFRIKHPLSCP